MRRPLMAAVALCGAAALTSCSLLSGGDEEEPERLAKVVLFVPEGTASGDGVVAAVELGLGESTDDIDGWTVEVEAVDDEPEDESIPELASGIADDDVVAVVGGLSTETVRAAQPVFDSASLLFISPADTVPEHTRGADDENPLRPYESYFRTAVSDDDPLAELARYATSALGMDTVAVIDADGEGEADAFAGAFREAEGEVLRVDEREDEPSGGDESDDDGEGAEPDDPEAGDDADENGGGDESDRADDESDQTDEDDEEPGEGDDADEDDAAADQLEHGGGFVLIQDEGDADAAEGEDADGDDGADGEDDADDSESDDGADEGEGDEGDSDDGASGDQSDDGESDDGPSGEDDSAGDTDPDDSGSADDDADDDGSSDSSVDETTVSVDDVDVMLDEAQAGDSDAVFVSGSANVAAVVADEIARRGLEMQLLGGSVLMSDAFLAEAGSSAEGALTAVESELSPEGGSGQGDAEARLTESGIDPGPYGAAAYDTGVALGTVLTRCLPSASSATSAREGCLGEFAEVRFDGATGEFAFDEFGDRLGAAPEIMEIRDSAWTTVDAGR